MLTLPFITTFANLPSCYITTEIATNDIKQGYLATLTLDAMKQLSDTKVFTTRLNLAQNIWQLMQDRSNLVVKMPHDGYLKLFYLSEPVFNVDCIMLDEAQDSNDVTLAIIDIAKCKHKMVVGDVHQAIYQFRGAKNSLTEFKKIANKTFYLTNSFRFNNNIADYASLVLGHFKNEINKVVGVGAHGEKIIIDGSKIKNTLRFILRINLKVNLK